MEQISLPKNLEKNIDKLYLLKFLTGWMLLMPVIVPFFQLAGIGMKGVYLLQSVFAVSVFILEVPSGYISDMLGRKKTLIVAYFLRGVGFSLFPLADGMPMLIVAEIVLAVSISLHSGTDTALIYDTMEATGSKKAQIKVLGKSMSNFSLGEGVSSLIASGLLLYSISLKDLSIISAIVCWVPFFITFTLVEPPRNKMQQKHSENFKYIFNNLFKQSKLLNLIILNSIFSFSGTLIAVWLFQKYWKDIGIALVYFGFLWALTNFVVSYVCRQAHKVEKKWGSTNILIFIGFLPIAGYMGISFVDHTLGFLVCLIFQVCRGLGQVVLKDALNKRVTGDFRATANSITQMGVRIFFTFVGPLVGWLIDSRGLPATAQYLSAFYVLVFLLVMLPMLNQRKNFIAIKT